MVILQSPLSLQVPKATTVPSLQPAKFPEPKAELRQSDTVKSDLFQTVRSLSPEAAQLPAWCWVCSPSCWLVTAPGCIPENAAGVNSLHPGAQLLLWQLTKEEEWLQARTGTIGISQFPLLRVKCTVNAMHDEASVKCISETHLDHSKSLLKNKKHSKRGGKKVCVKGTYSTKRRQSG